VGLVGDDIWSEWVLVVTESQLCEAVQVGYFGSTDESGRPGDISEDLYLSRGTDLERLSQEVTNRDSQLGLPVQIQWSRDYLNRLFPNPTRDQVRMKLRKVLPLTFGLYNVKLASSDRLALIQAFLPAADVGRKFLEPTRSAPTSPVQFAPSDSMITQKGANDASSSQTIPTRWEDVEREERLQCATELVLEVAEVTSQLEFAAELIGKPAEHVHLSDDFKSIVRFRHGDIHSDLIPEVLISNYLLTAPCETRLSPLTQGEKLEILKQLLSSTSLDTFDRGLLTTIEAHISADESIGRLKFDQANTWLQAFVMLLLHSESPAKVKSIDRNFHKVELHAISLCAFFVGLRFKRDRFPFDSIFLPLRSFHNMKIANIANFGTTASISPQIGFSNQSLYVDDQRFQPMQRCFKFVTDEPFEVLVKSSKKGKGDGREARVVKEIRVSNKLFLDKLKSVTVFRPNLKNCRPSDWLKQWIDFRKAVNSRSISVDFFSSQSLAGDEKRDSADSGGEFDQILTPIYFVETGLGSFQVIDELGVRYAYKNARLLLKRDPLVRAVNAKSKSNKVIKMALSSNFKPSRVPLENEQVAESPDFGMLNEPVANVDQIQRGISDTLPGIIVGDCKTSRRQRVVIMRSTLEVKDATLVRDSSLVELVPRVESDEICRGLLDSLDFTMTVKTEKTEKVANFASDREPKKTTKIYHVKKIPSRWNDDRLKSRPVLAIEGGTVRFFDELSGTTRELMGRRLILPLSAEPFLRQLLATESKLEVEEGASQSQQQGRLFN